MLTADRAAAQPQLGNLLPNPRITIVSPCGGKVGSTLEVSFTGTDLEEPKELLFSHPDIKATAAGPAAVDQPKPDPNKRPRRPVPQVAVTRFKVTIGPKVPVGIYDVRLVNKWGISNPRAFAVGDLVEVAEKEPNNDVDQAQRVDMNTTVTGAISAATDVDYFVFAAKKGQRVLVSCLASSLDSRLDAELRLYDAEGRQIASNHGYDGRDALVDVAIPENGDYHVRLCHFTYTVGGPDYFYRLSITTAPWIDAIHPPMIEPGKTAKVTVFGRNLPGGKPDKSAVVDGRVLEKATVEIKAPDDKQAVQRLHFLGRKPVSMLPVDGFEYRIRNDSGTSNPFLIGFARAPVVLDNEANDTPETAQAVPLPCEIAGRIEKRRDRDWYAFQAKKGEVLNIEVLSDRLGVPADMYFRLRNPATKQDIVEVDPNNEQINTSFKFFATTEDPGVYSFTAPADGTYQLMVTSRTADTLAGPRHYYRVRISAPQPDFRVVVMPPDGYRPDTCCVQAGGNQNYTAFVWRHDGFAGEVTLTAEGLPQGITFPPQTIGPGVKAAKVVVSAAPDAPAWTGEIKLKATATINGQVVEREVRSASIIWQGIPQLNQPMMSRLDNSVVLAVRGTAPYRLSSSLPQMTAVQGSRLTVPLKLERLWPDHKGQIQIIPVPRELPPQILTHGPVTIAGNANAGNIVLNISSNAPPGTYNIVFRSFGPVPFNKDPMSKAKPNINIVQPSAPLALTIVPKQLATVNLTNANPTIKLGMQAEVVVRVNRQFNYDGEFKVQLVLPPNAEGLSADEVTIPAGQTEAKLVIKVAPDAKPGNRQNLAIKTTAMFNGKVPIANENKINVNVVK
jgi:hypothetical protein